MSQYIEDNHPPIQSAGLNTKKAVDFSGAPTVALPTATTINGSTVTSLGTITSTSANAFAAGPNGTTNPTFNVDASTSSAATGFNVKSAAAAGGLALSVISSGTNESLTLDAKGSGTVTINGTGTGNVVIGSALAFGSDASAAKTIVAGSTNGLKIGTATTQKLGFYGSSPITCAVLATGASHTVDDVITALQNLGLVKQS